MFTQKMFSNNYAWSGLTALLYNVHLDEFFEIIDDAVSRKTNFNEHGLTEIGFELKKSSDSEWTSIMLLKGDTTLDVPNYFTYEFVNEVLEENGLNDTYKCYRLGQQQETLKTIYPFIILIKNLQSNTSYDLRSYYVCDEIKTTYNAQTISTLAGEVSSITFDEATYLFDISNEDKETINNKLNEVYAIGQEIYQMFFPNLTKHYTVAINQANYSAAMSGNQLYWSNDRNYLITHSIETMTSTLIHELAHSNMVTGIHEDNDDNIIKFMEFATNAPHASWRWLASHNYPIISSENYTYIENCLVVAACYVSWIFE